MLLDHLPDSVDLGDLGDLGAARVVRRLPREVDVTLSFHTDLIG